MWASGGSRLRWLNEQYIHELSYDQLVDALLAWRLGRPALTAIVPLVRERIKQLSDFVGVTEFFFAGDLDYGAVAAELL